MNISHTKQRGFTLIELLVVIAVIGILSAIVYVSFDDARKQARDKLRMAEIQQLQLAIELFKDKNGRYPEAGCGTAGNEWAGSEPSGIAVTVGGDTIKGCENYILGLVPEFIEQLPRDPGSGDTVGKGYAYRSNSAHFKLLSFNNVETLVVTGAGDPFARYGEACGVGSQPANTYAVYSRGVAECW